jgi:cell division protein FtsA
MFITALDFGTSEIKLLVAEAGKDGKLSIVEAIKVPSGGMNKGEVTDVDAATAALANAFDEIAGIDKDVMENMFVNINGKRVVVNNSRGIAAVSRGTNEIGQEDIDRAISGAEAIKTDKNLRKIHTLVQEYIIDGVDQIQNPLGMSGTRLEVYSMIVSAFTEVLNNLTQAIERAGGHVEEENIVYGPLAASHAALTKAHKDLGVVLIDIGAGTTSMSVFEENKLVSIKVFPVGATHITNDLAVKLKSSIATAEKVKIAFGHAIAREVSTRDKINLNEIDHALKGVITRREVAEVIESRLSEIFELVENELKAVRKTQLPAGAILCGGGAKTSGMIDLARQELNLPVHMANCEVNVFDVVSQDMIEKLEDVQFIVASGLLVEGSSQLGGQGGSRGKGMFESFKRIIRHIKP